MTKSIQQYLAEFIGTFFLVLLGCGAIILTDLELGGSSSLIPFVFGGTVSIMIYATGHISGAHFNPAVTLAFFANKQFPANKLLGYIGSQIAGATLASLVHSLMWSTGHDYGATFSLLSPQAAFCIEFIFSFLLMFVIMSVATDARAVGELAGLAIGLTVTLCAIVAGPLTGASMNPARSLGPALLSGDLSQIWLYALAPILGAACGGLIYQNIRCENEDGDQTHGCC